MTNRSPRVCRCVVTIVMLLFPAAAITAQSRTFSWQDELCSYRGTYDARVHTLAQIRNTLRLAEGNAYNMLDFKSTAFSPADIPTLDVPGFEAKYRKLAAELRGLDIVRSRYFEELRQTTLREMETVYRLNRVTMLAYSDRNILLTYTDAPACTTKYARPLIAGGAELLDVWRRVDEEARTKNSAPERLRRLFESRMRSADRERFALVEVMNFGWYNCANESVPYVLHEGIQQTEFKKLFRSVKSLGCDEP